MKYRVECTARGCYLHAYVGTVDSAELLAFAHEQRRATVEGVPTDPALVHHVSVTPFEPQKGGSPKGGPR